MSDDPPEPIEFGGESVVDNDREEARALRDESDIGGYRRINGVLYDTTDLPTEEDDYR